MVRRFGLRSALLVLAVLLACACDPGIGAAEEAAPENAWRGEVVRAIDGDTLDVRVLDPAGHGHLSTGERRRVRLLRIDAPERGGDSRPAECLYGEATQHLAELAPAGSTVLLTYDVEPRDRFGRDLAHVWTPEGTWVNGRQVLHGYARVVTFSPNVAHSADIRAAESDARSARRGLWNPERC